MLKKKHNTQPSFNTKKNHINNNNQKLPLPKFIKENSEDKKNNFNNSNGNLNKHENVLDETIDLHIPQEKIIKKKKIFLPLIKNKNVENNLAIKKLELKKQ